MKDRDVIVVIIILVLFFLGLVAFGAFKYRDLIRNALGDEL
jgi:hypothetical protein